jgi:hypothetical protein
MASHATHEDAKLLLQLYDLRREKRLRQARDFVQRDLKFKDYKDFQKRYPEGSKEGTYVGMVMGYWDLACTLVAKGLIADDLFNTTTFEHVAVWYKLKPIVEAWRKEYHYPDISKSLETVATRHPGASFFEPPEEGKSKSKKTTKAKAEKPAPRAEEPKKAKPRDEDEEEDEDESDLEPEEDDEDDD